MKPLERALRGQLERMVREARDVAEKAADSALKQLGVVESAPFAHQSEPERELRRKLRIHGRQLGDTLNGGKTQSMDRLVEEIAYEHWHRMLFARFLAENNLLMYPDPSGAVPVSLEECEDLAAKEGAKNGWELAARFATHMLPQIFRVDSPVFQLVLPPEYQQRLELLVAGLPAQVFLASDSLGWVYQFWQAKKKDEVNASEVKIGARELPAVTQLFTEPYMVSFLLDNSLGAWWAAHRLTREDLALAKSEQELRQKASLPGASLQYLRFIKGNDGLWTPAAGTFAHWPKSLEEFKVLDPCCGSGHFLVAALLMLAPMRMEMEGLSAKDSVNAVLRDNLNGLEIDRRCVELAAFSIAFTAWRYPNAGGYRHLPELNLACCGLPINAKPENWLNLANGDYNLRLALDLLHKHFKDAPTLGSLINPMISFGKGTLMEIRWENVAPLLSKALAGNNDERSEMGVIAQGTAKAAQLLTGKYNLVITNAPYLTRGKQSDTLREYCERYYSISKNDLATVFLFRCLELCDEHGTSSVVLPQNWLFLTSYKKLREELLRNETWHMIAQLGEGGFDSSAAAGAFVILLTISREKMAKIDLRLSANNCTTLISGIDVSIADTPNKKALDLISIKIKQTEQAKQLENPDARVTLEVEESGRLLELFAYSYHGLTSGDTPRMKLRFWEIENRNEIWFPFQGTVDSTRFYGGNSYLLRWERGKGAIAELEGARKDGTGAWGKKGVLISQMRDLDATLYSKFAFDNNAAVIVPNNDAHLPSIWCFCSSPEYNEAVRRIDRKISVTSATLVKVSFDLNKWANVAYEKFPAGLPKPYSEDPTQWIFHGHPAKSDHQLQVAVARLLGYQWPSEIDRFMELSEDALVWTKRTATIVGCTDRDGIVCIPPVRGEKRAEEQLEDLLATSHGVGWSSNKKSELLAEVGYAGKTLESWLREGFFTQHCRLFHDRPFIWHVWDGLSDGFAALVNYHKLDAKKLEMLIYAFLGDWISLQKQDIAKGVDGAEEKLAAAEGLKKRLELILEGEAPYDIFVRWKPLEEQPVGWNPDLNDGVRLNIRPFMSVPDVGKKGAGVLRDRPNIKWDKDRGKDVESIPWYELFKGERINDHHLTLAEKRKAREEKV